MRSGVVMMGRGVEKAVAAGASEER